MKKLILATVLAIAVGAIVIGDSALAAEVAVRRATRRTRRGVWIVRFLRRRSVTASRALATCPSEKNLSNPNDSANREDAALIARSRASVADARLEYRVTVRLISEAGFNRIVLSDKVLFWCAVARKA